MGLNVFKAARLTLRLVQVLTVLAFIAFIWTIAAGRRVQVAFDIQSPAMAPVLREQGGPICGDLHGDARMFVYSKTAKGTPVRSELCFRSVQVEGKRVIPYAVAEDGESLQVGERYSNDVNVYIKDHQTSFVLPDAVGRIADSERKLERYRDVTIAAVGGLVAWFGLSFLAWLAGRVVRELAGIPAGRDVRP